MPPHHKLPIACSVSILSSHLGKLVATLKMLQGTNANSIHFDVMDGHFVPNLTFGYQTISQLKKYCSKPFDVHLMISNPEKYIKNYTDAGAEIISIHREISKDVSAVIGVLQLIKKHGARSSLAYNPGTFLDVEPFLPLVDRILIMAVHPGFGGQKFIPKTISRGEEVAKKIASTGRPVELQVDGGVNESNATQLKAAGFNQLVAGSYVVDKNFPHSGTCEELSAATRQTQKAIALLQTPLKN